MTEQLAEALPDIAPQPVAPGPIRIAWATVPRVNLLPIEIVEARRFRRVQLVLGVTVVSTLLIAGGGTYLAQRATNKAHDRLHASQTQVTRLQSEENRYAAVPLVIAEVDAANTARTLALGSDVLWYRYLNDVDDARPANVELSALSVTMNNAAAVAAPSSNPLSNVGIGTITATGTAQKYKDVANWLDAVEKITGLSSSALSSAAEADGKLTFSSGAIVDSDALSGRYDKKAG
jgi:hypothetical protein